MTITGGGMHFIITLETNTTVYNRACKKQDGTNGDYSFIDPKLSNKIAFFQNMLANFAF